jgi:hypothetical protein
MGDIVRVHRASVKEFNGRKQLHVNVHFNSSWVLFAQGQSLQAHGEDSYRSYRFSGKNHSFEPLVEN